MEKGMRKPRKQDFHLELFVNLYEELSTSTSRLIE